MTITVLHSILLAVIAILLMVIVYIKGMRDGKNQELKKFSIKCTPTIIEKDSFLKKSKAIECDMQIHYDNFPIGESWKKTIEYKEEFKDYKVDKLINCIEKSLQIAHYLIAKTPIPISVSSEVKSKVQTKDK